MDGEHWLKKNDGLFRPKPTVEDVLREFIVEYDERGHEEDELIAEYAEKLRLAGEDE